MIDEYINSLLDVNTRRLLDSLPGGVIIYKRSKAIETKYYSAGVLRITGHSPYEYEDLVNGDPTRIIYEGDRPHVTTEIMEALEDNTVLNTSFRVKHKNGELIWVTLNAERILEDRDGELYQATVSKQAEDSAMYREITEESNIGIVVIQAEDDSVLFANGAWRAFEGLSPEIIVTGRSIHDIILPRNLMILDADRELIKDGEYTVFHKANRFGQYIEISARATVWNGKRAYAYYLRDETELQNREHKLRFMLDKMPGGMGIFEISGDTVSAAYINEGYYRMIGVSRERRALYARKNVLSAVNAEDLPIVKDAANRMVAGENFAVLRYRIMTGDKEIWYQLTASVAERTGDKVTVYCSFTDIDALMRSQQEKENAYEDKLRVKRVLSGSVLAQAIINLTKNKVSEIESPRAEIMDALCGDTADEALAGLMDLYGDFMDDNDLSGAKSCRALLASYRKGRRVISARHRVIFMRGWLETTFDILENPYTGDTEAIMILRDVTERVRGENVVNKLVDYDFDSIFIIDANTYAPLPFFRRYSNGQSMCSESFLRANCAPQDAERAIRETRLPYVKRQLEDTEVFSVIYSVKKGAGIARKHAAFMYLDDARDVILLTIQDITEVYRMEEEQKTKLAKALHAAERASKAKTDFLSNMSHDMRTPMNGILGLVGLMRDKTDLADIRADLNQIAVSGRYLLGLINDTLDMNRIESGNMELHIAPAEITGVFETAINNARLMAEDKGVEMASDMNAPKSVVMLDADRLSQLITNVASNAVKYTHEGGRVDASIKLLSASGGENAYEINVRDTGIGMSREFIEHIFEPFSQEGREGVGRLNGTGLGMSIVKKLTDMMGGSIDIDSEIGKGTEIRVLLRFKKTDEKPGEVKAAKAEMDALAGRRVLICEDQPLNMKIAATLLNRAGVVTQGAENGRAGAEAFENSPAGYFDAILMDVRMPIMNGMDATRRIRLSGAPGCKDIPIIAMTANAFEEDVRDCISAGMNAHISKPFDPETLYIVLSRQITAVKGTEK